MEKKPGLSLLVFTEARVANHMELGLGPTLLHPLGLSGYHTVSLGCNTDLRLLSRPGVEQFQRLLLSSPISTVFNPQAKKQMVVLTSPKHVQLSNSL